MSAAEKFVLRSTPTSPFGRKVRMAIDTLGLNGRIAVVPADPLDESDTLRKQNPLGKMPCLVLPDDSTIYDSGIIIEYLQDIAGTDRLTRLGPLRVRYGSPIPVEDLRGKEPGVAAREATKRLMAEIARLREGL